jgi:hypothetical protein
MFFDNEVKAATQWYSEERNWSIRQSNAESTTHILRDFRKHYSFDAMASWVLLAMLIAHYSV